MLFTRPMRNPMSLRAQRLVAGSSFAALTFLPATLMFLRPSMAMFAVLLYMLLPALAAGAAGAMWGAPLLDSRRTWLNALLRSFGITFAAYLMFAVLFACGIVIGERGWAFSQIGGLILMTLTLGLLMVVHLLVFVALAAVFLLRWLGRVILQRRSA